MENAPTSRPRSPSMSPAPPQPPPIPPTELSLQQAQRRSSFNFLRRGKSVERLNSKRSISGNKLTKRQLKELEMQPSTTVADHAPRIPDLATPPQLQTFGGEDTSVRRDSHQSMPSRHGRYGQLGHGPRNVSTGPYNVPIPDIPKSAQPEYVDPYARTESMTHRGRYSYASSAASTLNSPRRVRKRKDPTPFK